VQLFKKIKEKYGEFFLFENKNCGLRGLHKLFYILQKIESVIFYYKFRKPQNKNFQIAGRPS
jgi:hypothetical protein